MFEIRVSNVIRDIVRKVYPRWIPSKIADTRSVRGIMFCLDVSVNDYNKTIQERKLVYFIVSSDHAVWMLDCDFVESRHDHPITDWVNTSNHDECWSTDGIDRVLSRIYFDMCEKVNPDIPPIALSKHVSFHCGLYEHVQLTWEMDKTDKHTYKRRLKSVQITGE